MASIWKKAKSILHILLLALGLILLLLHLNYVCLECGKHVLVMQFVDATIGGFTYLMIILFIGMCVKEELERKTQMAISYTGAICHALALQVFISYFVSNDSKSRLMGTMIVCALLTFGYFFEAIWITVRKDLDQTVE